MVVDIDNSVTLIDRIGPIFIIFEYKALGSDDDIALGSDDGIALGSGDGKALGSDDSIALGSDDGIALGSGDGINNVFRHTIVSPNN